MRLRTRLALSFAALALLPLLLVVPVALKDLRRTLTFELDTRVDVASRAADAVLDRTRDDVRRSVEELADSVALEEVARELHQGGGPRTATAAQRLMKSRGLTVLSLFDAQGKTLSSGHLPARLGDPDPALFAVTRRAERDAVTVEVELRTEAGLRPAPALVAARELDYGDVKLWIVGGVLLDEPLARHLSNLTGARVEIRSGKERVATSGNVAPPVRERVLPLPPAAEIRLSFSRAALLAAEAGVLRAFAFIVGLSLLFAVGIGFLLARRITRPVEALTTAAREIGTGRLDVQVEEQASGEVGELVRAFNRMTSELSRTTGELVASERVAAWQEVARRLAHEIKNPLTPIKMSLETLLAAHKSQNPRFPALFQESAGAVLEEVERLRRIVDEFSRFARLPRPVLQPLLLGDFAAQVLQLYAAPPEGIRIDHELAPNLTVRADRDQLTQVLVNLVKNAEEAMPRGGRLSVRVARDGAGFAALEVVDDGPGIPLEERTRIFEPWFTTKEGGTGLGLAIASRICLEHGGKLVVDGAEGRGARFRVLLPLTES